jgi:hypothetical protein
MAKEAPPMAILIILGLWIGSTIAIVLLIRAAPTTTHEGTS